MGERRHGVDRALLPVATIAGSGDAAARGSSGTAAVGAGAATSQARAPAGVPGAVGVPLPQRPSGAEAGSGRSPVPVRPTGAGPRHPTRSRGEHDAVGDRALGGASSGAADVERDARDAGMTRSVQVVTPVPVTASARRPRRRRRRSRRERRCARTSPSASATAKGGIGVERRAVGAGERLDDAAETAPAATRVRMRASERCRGRPVRAPRSRAA